MFDVNEYARKVIAKINQEAELLVSLFVIQNPGIRAEEIEICRQSTCNGEKIWVRRKTKSDAVAITDENRYQIVAEKMPVMPGQW